jgi:LPS-assembly lipoprotein
MIGARAILLGLAMCATGMTGGCGFHAVYAAGNPSMAALSSVYVDLLSNRNGQLLRQALQARLEATDDTTPKRYTLKVTSFEHVTNVNVQQDNSVTRQRAYTDATWTLYALDKPSEQLATGKVRSVDGYNVIDGQFFYQNLETEAAEHRLADALAEQVVLGLANYFNRHPDKALAAK